MNIGDVATISGLPVKTIRYYEEIDLVRPGRGANGYRRFSDSDVQKLVFIARARSLGFTIEECRTLLSLYEDRSRASADVRSLASDHLDQIDVKVAELLAMRRTLADLVERCRGDDRPDCPILDGLAHENRKRMA
jgi:Cu(I)-responsive transcriptional regulator